MSVRKLRVERGWSQEQLALSAEIDVSYLGRVERGDNNVAVLRLERIAKALGMTMAELMVEAGL